MSCLANALAARRSNECVYARELSHGTKTFFTSTRENFINRSNEHFADSAKPLLLYECITGPCLFFIDVDGCSDIHNVMGWIRQFGATFRVYHSPPKASWHIRGAVGSKIYATIYELKEAIQSAGPPPEVDMSVYTKRRLLRCVGSTKWGEERPLVPWDPLDLGCQRTVSYADLVALPGDVGSPSRSTRSERSERSERSPTHAPDGSGFPDPLQYFMANVSGHSPYVARSMETLDGDSMTIFVNSHDCAIAGRRHRSNHIFFNVSGTTIEQRCFKCAGSVRVVTI